MDMGMLPLQHPVVLQQVMEHAGYSMPWRERDGVYFLRRWEAEGEDEKIV